MGAEATAEDLRVWSVGARTVAVGLIDDGVLRLALDLAAADDDDAAAHLACTLEDSAQDLFSDGEWLVEARGATALRRLLIASGWTDDEPWSPLALDLSVTRLPLPTRTLRVERVGLEAAEDWTSVHWSAFQGTPFTGERRDRFTSRWGTMLTGPLADRAQCLMGYDEQGQPVAVATVWSADQGRPGLIEPMGVHRDHHGHGYGTAITVAGARALQLAGASSAVVAAEDSNPAALATYRAAGFRSLGTVRDLRRG
ncbi:Acetyltransferase (GNAT) family protein [Micrococcus terreus]|uniref:Acetyltransferase (GNAT) family protein n=1 Tax=Micrococcus terreus TaxID=574650 RepID=A0A1I7MEV6_9MICC|nr:Acetyltransferase (GNAT) family protein [Micrococcus terreus]